MSRYEDNYKDEDDYYDDEEDDYEDEKVKNGKRKGKKMNKKQKKKKNQVSQFFDEEVEESENDEEEEITEEMRIKNRQQEKLYMTRKNRGLDDVIRDLDQEQDIAQRYRFQQSDDEYDDDDYDEDLDDIPENLKKHKIKVREDQKIFSVPVRKTKEREIVISLLNKFAQLNPTNNYGIYSISHVPSSEATIFVEGRSKRDVLNFLKQYPDVNISKIEMVNNDEYIGIYQDKEIEKFNVEIGMYVKISQKAKNCDYINDMGQIFDIRKNNRVVVKLIPRVNIDEMKKKYMDTTSKLRKNGDTTTSFVQVEGETDYSDQRKVQPGKFFKNKFNKGYLQPFKTIQEIESTRPNQQFFSFDEYGDEFEKYYRAVSEYYQPENDEDGKGHCGYVYKLFNCKDLILNYQPKTLEELKKFYPHLEIDQILNENAKFIKMASQFTNFVIGDSVIINGGQMKGLKGKIVSLNKETAKVTIKNRKQTFEEEIELKDLIKHFDDGARVKVISGNSEGITGSVLSTEGDICFVFTDNNNTIEVRTKDLAITGESGQDVDRNNMQEVGGDKNLDLKKKDLVKLTGFNNFGLVLDISKDFIKILDQNGKIKNVSQFSINTKIDTRRVIQKNAEGSNITNNSNVIIKHGQFAGYQCQVIHVFKHLVFLFNPKFRDTYTVENINNISLQTTNPIVQWKDAKIAYDMKYGKQDNLRPDDMRQYVGKQMRIIGGQYKGFQCTVLDIRNDQIKVEINSKFITAFIQKSDLIAQDKLANNDLEYGKTPSYITQSTYQPSFRENTLGSPNQY